MFWQLPSSLPKSTPRARTPAPGLRSAGALVGAALVSPTLARGSAACVRTHHEEIERGDFAPMEGAPPRSVDEVYEDFVGRRAGISKALTSGEPAYSVFAGRGLRLPTLNAHCFLPTCFGASLLLLPDSPSLIRPNPCPSTHPHRGRRIFQKVRPGEREPVPVRPSRLVVGGGPAGRGGAAGAPGAGAGHQLRAGRHAGVGWLGGGRERSSSLSRTPPS